MRWGALAVAALAVLAGCGSLGGDAASTVTPAPVPEPTPAPDRQGPDLAPGVTDEGVVDVSRLSLAHREAVANTSYVWHDETVVTSRLNDTEATNHHFQELRVENETTYRYLTDRERSRRNGALTFLANYSEYADGDERFARFVPLSTGTLTYVRGKPAPVSSRHTYEATEAVETYLDVDSTTVSTTRVDGQRHYVLVSDGPPPPWLGDVRDFSVRAVVSPRGLVRSLEAGYESVQGDRVERVEYEYRYEDVGETTVEAPAWVGEQWPDAVEGGGENGTASAIENGAASTD